MLFRSAGRQPTTLGPSLTYADVVKPTEPAIQPKPKPIPAQSHLPNTSQDNTINGLSQQNQDSTSTDEEQGKNPWILVSRRKHRGLNSKGQKQHTRSRHATLMMEQKRCFKCLQRGHTQFQCRNGVICLNCKGIGHIARMCTTKGPTPRKLKPPTFTTQPHAKLPRLTHTAEAQQHPALSNKIMDLEYWETMAMQAPAEIAQRAAPVKIFPPNDDMRPPNTLLHRSAVVLLGPNGNLTQMPFRIANSLATSLGRHPKEFTVSETDPSFGDYLVTFTSNMLRNMACYVDRKSTRLNSSHAQ